MDDILKCPLCGGVKFQDQGNSSKCLYCGASIEKPKQNKASEIVTPIAGNNPQQQNITVIVNSPIPAVEKTDRKKSDDWSMEDKKNARVGYLVTYIVMLIILIIASLIS